MFETDLEARPQRRTAARGRRPQGTRASRRGLLVVLTGDGKGKSTAAWGMALRAVGRGRAVQVFQFTKAQSARVGEYRAFEKLGVAVDVLGSGFQWDCRDAAHCMSLVSQSWARARTAIEGGEPFMVILDDLIYPLRQGWLGLDEVLQVLRSRPAHVHIVVTGRNAPQDLLDQADTVTRMGLTKHHCMMGVPSQRGIED